MIRDHSMPCTQDCQNRTPTCKFDGTCGKYTEWRKVKDDKYWACVEVKTKEYEVNDYMIGKVSKRSRKGKK